MSYVAFIASIGPDWLLSLPSTSASDRGAESAGRRKEPLLQQLWLYCKVSVR